MQLCVYIKDFAPFLCEAIWLAAVAAHAILIIWFSKNFMLNLPKGLQREYRRYISSAENKAAADYQVPLNQEILRP